MVGFAHVDGGMQSSATRKFTLFDAMVMVAATAVAFIPIRLRYNDQLMRLSLQEYIWAQWSVGLFGWGLNLSASVLVVAWGAALCFLRLRRPRPRLVRICRQPGMAACFAVVAATIYSFTQYGMLMWFYHYNGKLEWSKALDGLRSEAHWSTFTGWVDMSVPLVWLVLWSGKACRLEASWIDRTGRVLGVYCTIACILFGWADLAAKA
jgi:hypothetical protein